MLTLSLTSTFAAPLTPSSLTKTCWSNWVPWQGSGKPLCPCLKILHLKKKKILHLLCRQSLLPHKGRKPTGIRGKDVDVFGGGGGHYSATSSFHLYEHLLLHPFTLLPSLHLYAIYPPV